MSRRFVPTALLPAIVLAAASTLSACSLAPAYDPPEVVTPEQWEATDEWRPATPADTDARGPWWQAFDDPVLDDLESRLEASSLDLRIAVARYEQAQALAGRVRADLLPVVTAGAEATRARTSENLPSSAPGEVGNTYRASASASWEIDLFGRLRNAASAAGDRADAAGADLAATRLSLQALLAQHYFSLRGLQATEALLTDTVEAYDKALRLTRNRYQGGITAAADVDRAQSQLETARAQLASTQLDRAQLLHAIAVLLGESPTGFSLEPAPFVAEPLPVTLGLPSALLERRPDIAAAERRVAAANAEIGVARAAWFPVFSFGASYGYGATAADDWFEAPSRFWSLGPAAALTLFDGGARRALNAQAMAAYDETVASYRLTVLDAYREVEDNLAAVRQLAEVERSNVAAAEAASRALFHANERYAAGVSDYLEVTSLQTLALDAQRAALSARVQRVSAGVQLVRALGGGWQADSVAGSTP